MSEGEERSPVYLMGPRGTCGGRGGGGAVLAAHSCRGILAVVAPGPGRALCRGAGWCLCAHSRWFPPTTNRTVGSACTCSASAMRAPPAIACDRARHSPLDGVCMEERCFGVERCLACRLSAPTRTPEGLSAVAASLKAPTIDLQCAHACLRHEHANQRRGVSTVSCGGAPLEDKGYECRGYSWMRARICTAHLGTRSRRRRRARPPRR